MYKIKDTTNLHSLKFIKKLGRYPNVKYLYLLEGDIIKKQYINSRKNKKTFEKEIYLLKYLDDCDYTPKLIHADYDNLIIYISYMQTEQNHNLDK